MSETLSATLERPLRLFADREAVIDGDERWTYRELGQRVAAFDSGLTELGLAAGEVVAVLGLNSASHLVAWLAVPRSGRVLNDLNVRLAPTELRFILEDCSARVLLVDDAFLEVGRELTEDCVTVEQLIYIGAGATPDGCLSFAEMTAGEGAPAASVDSGTVAGIFYTGGTTGLPKGAMLTHRNLIANARHFLIALPYSEQDIYLHAAPMFHLADGSSTHALTWVGGRHVMIPAFDPELWLGTVAAERVTRGTLVPSMINVLVNHPTLTSHDLSCLRSIYYGGSPMPGELLRRAMEVFDCEWSQLYGMTEAAPVVTLLGAEDHLRGSSGEEPYATRLRSAGRPVVGVEAQVCRADGSLAEVGEPGEVWVRGPNIMKGYWKRDDETEAALDAEGWYHSGDAAYADAEGYLFIVDRLKDMIISGGENVYCTEVENAIYRHPAVLECAVFGVPDESWGERVHAAIVLKPNAIVEESAITEHCRSLIAGYKLPRSFDLGTEPLPKSGAGKILKRELREPYWAGEERQVS